MNMKNRMTIAAAVVSLSALSAWAQSKPPATQQAIHPSEQRTTVAQAYPNLASAALVHAKLAGLPEGVLLRAGKVAVTQTDINAHIAKAPPAVQQQLRKNAFFLLEQTATQKLLLVEAREVLAEAKVDLAAMSDKQILQAYLDRLVKDVAVTDIEAKAFYEQNKDMVGGATFEQVQQQLRQYLLGQKKQEAVNDHVATLGRRMKIEVDGAWAKKQATLAADNPADKARSSGRPSLVDFGSKGCRPCDMLAPILKTLEQKYEGRANVVFISVREEQILAARYGIQSIPVQIFFDKHGKEVFRHSGFWPQQELEKKMAEMGVK